MMNPYQSPFPDEFRDEKTRGYEAAIEAHERLVTELRDRVGELEGENERLKRRMRRLRPVLGVFMESADID